jgi:tetratricopeptide (TPR) repeat protein
MPETFDGDGPEAAVSAAFLKAQASEFIAQGDKESAVRSLLAAIEADPRDAATMQRCAHELHDLERFSEAAALCERAVAIAPDDASLWIDLGFSLEPLGERDRAYAAYTRASEVDPTDAMGLNNRAFLQLSEGALDAALIDVDAAIARDEDTGIAHATRAEILAQQGEIDRAFDALTKAIETSLEWLDTAHASDFLAPLRAHPRWVVWLAEMDESHGDG